VEADPATPKATGGARCAGWEAVGRGGEGSGEEEGGEGRGRQCQDGGRWRQVRGGRQVCP